MTIIGETVFSSILLLNDKSDKYKVNMILMK